MEKKTWLWPIPGPTAQKENVRTWSSLRWEGKKADGGQGSRAQLRGLSMMTQPLGWWSSTTGVTKPGVVCKFAVLRVTKRDEARFASISVVQRASGPRRRLNILKNHEDPVGLATTGGQMYSREVSTTLFYRTRHLAHKPRWVLIYDYFVHRGIQNRIQKNGHTHDNTLSSTWTSRRFLFNGRIQISELDTIGFDEVIDLDE
jgi:hypothetical protein